ncbi:hypothetical protein [Yinghuangia sp. YIM S09857]|uniref:hypothetical protein n=1 Tax=Yinghuangia sp. YIM S09857 TaxID=3436929 RepID=UPI003F53BAA0
MEQQPVPGRPSGRNPWIATGATAGVALALIAALLTTAGNGEAAPPRDSGPGVTARPPAATQAPADTPSLPPTATGPKSDWNNAAGDTDPFTAEVWFPELGPTTIQNRPYTQVAQDTKTCNAAEPKMQPLLDDTCIGIVRSLWTNGARTHVAQLSVVSVVDKAAAETLAERMSAGRSDGDWVSFIPPPPDSGLHFSEEYPTWHGPLASGSYLGPFANGHFVVLIEVARSDGTAIDPPAKTMHSDLKLVAMEHINYKVWSAVDLGLDEHSTARPTDIPEPPVLIAP